MRGKEAEKDTLDEKVHRLQEGDRRALREGSLEDRQRSPKELRMANRAWRRALKA